MRPPARESLNFKASEPLQNSLHRILSLVSGFLRVEELIRGDAFLCQGDAQGAHFRLTSVAFPIALGFKIAPGICYILSVCRTRLLYGIAEKTIDPNVICRNDRSVDFLLYSGNSAFEDF